MYIVMLVFPHFFFGARFRPDLGQHFTLVLHQAKFSTIDKWIESMFQFVYNIVCVVDVCCCSMKSINKMKIEWANMGYEVLTTDFW